MATVSDLLLWLFFFYPATEPRLLGNMGWAQKTLKRLPKCFFFEPMEKQKKDPPPKKKGHPVLVTATLCDFHHVCKVDISQITQKQHCRRHDTGYWRRPREVTGPSLHLHRSSYSWAKPRVDWRLACVALVSIPLTAVRPKHWGKKIKKLKNVVFFPKCIDLLHYHHEAQENQKHLTLLCHDLSQFCSLTLLPQHLSISWLLSGWF